MRVPKENRPDRRAKAAGIALLLVGATAFSTA